MSDIPDETDMTPAEFEEVMAAGEPVDVDVADPVTSARALLEQVDWEDSEPVTVDPMLLRGLCCQIDLLRVELVARNVFRPEDVLIWMVAPNQFLGDRTPVQMIAAGETDRVFAVIEALADGVAL